MDHAEEDHVEPVIGGPDPAEALEPAAEAFYLVASAVALSVLAPGAPRLDQDGTNCS